MFMHKMTDTNIILTGIPLIMFSLKATGFKEGLQVYSINENNMFQIFSIQIKPIKPLNLPHTTPTRD